jgi:hypothetical protein
LADDIITSGLHKMTQSRLPKCLTLSPCMVPGDQPSTTPWPSSSATSKDQRESARCTPWSPSALTTTSTLTRLVVGLGDLFSPVHVNVCPCGAGAVHRHVSGFGKHSAVSDVVIS